VEPGAIGLVSARRAMVAQAIGARLKISFEPVAPR
jgi:hypothetical protein